MGDEHHTDNSKIASPFACLAATVRAYPRLWQRVLLWVAIAPVAMYRTPGYVWRYATWRLGVWRHARRLNVSVRNFDRSVDDLVAFGPCEAFVMIAP